MQVVDSHTGGEPTRVILDGGPALGKGSLAERARRLANEHGKFYRSIMLEPRGQPAMVGALLVEADHPDCMTGVIYFDVNAVLGMCGHGTIGLAVTLAHLGRIDGGRHTLDTPAGVVTIDLLDPNTVRLTNIESRRVRQAVSLELDELGTVTGDVAYGGNWFFIVDPSPIPVTAANIPALTGAARCVREASIRAGIGGEQGEPIDHVIFQGRADDKRNHGRNFVLCPDDAYDRSPCGTGCSAMLACLAADDKLSAGKEIVQESVIGSTYRLSYQHGADGGVIPSITGKAFVIAESRLLFNAIDPFKEGIAP